jgi:NADH-ubiquinone/plastoquinone oxidoreductase, chain 3.
MLRSYIPIFLLVIFDVETVFMFPWAVSLDRLAVFGLVEMMVLVFGLFAFLTVFLLAR